MTTVKVNGLHLLVHMGVHLFPSTQGNINIGLLPAGSLFLSIMFMLTAPHYETGF